MTDSAQLTKRQQQGAASREQILDAAERLMATRGVTGTSMSTLIDACGLPASSIYWHFGSKDGVLVAVMERGAERFFTSLAPQGSFSGSGGELVRAQLEDAARALEEHGDFLHLLLTLLLLRNDGNDPAGTVIESVRRRGRERIQEMLLAALSGRDKRSARRTAAAATDFVLAAIDGAFIAHHEDSRIDLHDMLAQLALAIEALLGDPRPS